MLLHVGSSGVGVGNPAKKVTNPRRLPTTCRIPGWRKSTRSPRPPAMTRDLDTLILRLHTETACRRGGALALRPRDLDPECCIECNSAPFNEGNRRMAQ
jgi:integrase/recombinase XerC